MKLCFTVSGKWNYSITQIPEYALEPGYLQHYRNGDCFPWATMENYFPLTHNRPLRTPRVVAILATARACSHQRSPDLHPLHSDRTHPAFEIRWKFAASRPTRAKWMHKFLVVCFRRAAATATNAITRPASLWLAASASTVNRLINRPPSPLPPSLRGFNIQSKEIARRKELLSSLSLRSSTRTDVLVNLRESVYSPSDLRSPRAMWHTRSMTFVPNVFASTYVPKRVKTLCDDRTHSRSPTHRATGNAASATASTPTAERLCDVRGELITPTRWSDVGIHIYMHRTCTYVFEFTWKR